MGLELSPGQVGDWDASARISLLLEALRPGLGARLLAIAEIASTAGSLQPRWLAVTGQVAEPEPLDIATFRALVEASVAAPVARDLSAFGAPFNDQLVSVLVLTVRPALLRTGDTLLFAVPESGTLDPLLVSALARRLEPELCERRLNVLGRVALAALTQAADPVELSDREARLFFTNEAWQQAFGIPADEALGEFSASLLRDPVDSPHHSTFYRFTQKEIARGRSWLGALFSRSRRGERLLYEVGVTPFEAPDEHFCGNIVVRRDVAHRADRDSALTDAHREFRAVLTAMPDGVVVVRDGRIYFCNPAFLATVGLDEARVIGQEFLGFVHSDDRESFERDHRSQVTRVRILAEGGAHRLAEISTAGAVSFEGGPSTILVSRDTTDYQLAQEQLVRAEKLTALGTLAAGVAHELNNPLAYVALNLGIVRESAVASLTPADLEALDEAIEGVARMRGIAMELRAFSGTDHPGPLEPVDVERAITSALNIAQNEIRHRARLHREVDSNLFVSAREGQLVQVLVNLLANAAQSIGEPDIERHQVSVVARGLGADQVEIQIVDSGVGIPPERLGRIFEAFATSKQRGEGSGLGLAISKRIISSFNGTICIESELGHGTRAVLLLPRTERKQSPAELAPEPGRAAAVRARVLIIDDERQVTRALRRVLWAHDVVTVNDGQQALELLEAGEHFDVLVCDLMMPVLSGWSFYAKACALRPELARRFVFMTGGALTGAAFKFIEEHSTRVLAKPFNPSQVLHFVEELAKLPD